MSASTVEIAYHADWVAANESWSSALARRGELVTRYSWAIPSAEALSAIAQHAPPHGIVEIGAGGGYWASLLQQAGVPVVAYDPAPPPNTSQWHDGHPWADVLLGDHTSVIGHPDRALMLCWPNYDEGYGAEAVDLYGGDTVIFIGERSSGCTGDARLHALLGEADCWCPHELCVCGAQSTTPLFREVAEVAIPQWQGIHDSLRVHRRITSATHPEERP
ncbi:MAG: hypothetical protein ACRCZP_16345 [Phycicoccus sp.]